MQRVQHSAVVRVVHIFVQTLDNTVLDDKRTEKILAFMELMQTCKLHPRAWDSLANAIDFHFSGVRPAAKVSTRLERLRKSRSSENRYANNLCTDLHEENFCGASRSKAWKYFNGSKWRRKINGLWSIERGNTWPAGFYVSRHAAIPSAGSTRDEAFRALQGYALFRRKRSMIIVCFDCSWMLGSGCMCLLYALESHACKCWQKC